MTTRFRTKIFLASLLAAAASLLVAAFLFAWQSRDRQGAAIEARLVSDALLISELLGRPTVEAGDLDGEADRLAEYVDGRVTLVAPDGHVVGDSAVPAAGLAALENHGARPEIAAARDAGRAVTRRYSTTVDAEMLYVAVQVRHPRVAFVRLARPLVGIDRELAGVWRITLLALAATIPVALLVAWLISAPLARRVDDIAAMARRYADGDLRRPSYQYGSDELGQVARVLDRTVQELAARVAELSRDRARQEAILSGMVEGVLVLDSQGRVQLVNDAAQRMLKVDATAVGRAYVEAIRHPDIAAQLDLALRGAEADSRELSMARDPGRTFIARAAPVSTAGGGAVLVLHDITDLRRADEIRRDFVANVSHELRTPLTAIRGYVEALLEDPADEAHTRRFLEIVARQSARMERLVKDLLRLARLDARQEPLEVARCDLPQLFTAIVTDLAPAVEAKRQRVTIEVDDEACAVDADPAKLHDVVRNLVENAVSYSPDDASIRLSARRTGGTVRIQVADSGPGIPPEDVTRVFERFYRVEKSRAGPGTGLGLAIVKDLVELHGGEVRVENRPEGGALFTVVLPASGGGGAIRSRS